ncbi:prolipoprotein diacylglyceryl transferase [Botrimarina sp.]|uniref:prolipoprotein diacylglyceryl transferase n=1 Tax=Botrimarina sp. TaxID=2795802 RepID=UPI0032EE6EE8
MCSELLRIPVEIGGVPILGFGVLAALWLLGWGVVMGRHAVRRGVDGDFWAYAQPAAIGLVVLLLAPRFAPAGVPIRGYGVMLLIGISVGVAMAVHRAQRHGIAADTIFGLAFWLFVAGIVGARAFFVIEYWETRFARRPAIDTLVDVLRFTEGGLVVYGSVIGGLAAFVVYCLRLKLPVRGMADLVAPCFLAGLAIGRIGCLLNGCCYGGQTDAPWAVTFPPDSPPYMDQLVHGELHGLRIEEAPTGVVTRVGGEVRRVESISGQPVANLNDVAEVLGAAAYAGQPVTVRLADGQTIEAPPTTRQRSLPVHPTQVYSSVNAALLAWLLWSWFPSRRRDGEVALLLFTLYPISRFLLEAIRTDEQAIFGTGLSISQNVSLVVLVLAAVGWALLLRTPPGRSLVERPLAPGDSARTTPASAA